MIKRACDFSAALGGLIVLAPLLGLVAVLVKLSSPGPVFFRQERMGRGMRPFRIYKFRTMVVDAPRLGGQLTQGEHDPRITRVGRWLRRTKLDELPQLINVVLGQMSLVGPRPEVPRYVERFAADFAEVLSIRPGITDLASLKYRDEAALLGQVADTEAAYERYILPDKIRLAKHYAREQSLALDLRLIWATVLGGTVPGLGELPQIPPDEPRGEAVG